MARISRYLGQPLPGTKCGLFGLPKIQDYDDLIGEGGRKSCLITGKNKPRKGGFYNDNAGGYVISTEAVINKEVAEGYEHLGRTFRDAMSDAEMTKDEIEKEKKWILENIKRGMDKKIK